MAQSAILDLLAGNPLSPAEQKYWTAEARPAEEVYVASRIEEMFLSEGALDPAVLKALHSSRAMIAHIGALAFACRHGHPISMEREARDIQALVEQAAREIAQEEWGVL